MKYPDIHALMKSEPEAKRCFDQLPEYVREQMLTRPAGINSLASLKNYAENLTRGEG